MNLEHLDDPVKGLDAVEVLLGWLERMAQTREVNGD